MTNQQVIEIWDKRLKKVFSIKPEVYNFLLHNEHKVTAMDAVMREIKLVEIHHTKLLNLDNFKPTIEALCDFWARTILDNEENSQRSALERARLAAEAKQDEIAENQLKQFIGKPHITSIGESLCQCSVDQKLTD